MIVMMMVFICICTFSTCSCLGSKLKLCQNIQQTEEANRTAFQNLFSFKCEMNVM